MQSCFLNLSIAIWRLGTCVLISLAVSRNTEATGQFKMLFLDGIRYNCKQDYHLLVRGTVFCCQFFLEAPTMR
ncbi:uncharacterized protein F5891DRAFT_581212 [Suillus fuscotomentosus]|uniref:Secreted protein n=1 Tax=Suillus fuscotomentosus TaxID=1912939 RepID=A0AAD4E1P0_9AGAM|nr:uncharacterized protein F5891DRAFT_581212 [Suillus fuscotomentosus]KAG1896658.1 hypothetical protein F5891DRAFT_581212 [Suillus fuscotomentosus]